MVLSYVGRYRALVIAAVILLASWSAWAQYNPDTGPHKVLVLDHVVLHDAQRNKDVQVKVYYPAEPGPFPVIIFSHGALASKDAYWALGQYWASFGYVSIHPSHADSVADNGFRGTVLDAISDPGGWTDRPKDISFIIDSLGHLEELAPGLKHKLDVSRIGVGGHSFGAYTAEAIGGATVLLPGEDKTQSFRESRVAAVVMLSPEGAGEMGLTERSWDNFHIPMLLMYGGRDGGPRKQAPAWRSEPFHKSPPGDKFEVELKGATHMAFAGPLLQTDLQTRVFRCAKLETLAFWDAYLKGDRQAKWYLTTNALRGFSAAAVTFEQK
jgi:predicted dienelactone hydrolase